MKTKTNSQKTKSPHPRRGNAKQGTVSLNDTNKTSGINEEEMLLLSEGFHNGYIKGRKEAIEEVEKMIDEIKVDIEGYSCKMIFAGVFKQKLKEMQRK